MNWKTIMKESRKDKDRIYEDSEGFDERRTKLVGGSDKDKFGRIQDNEETYLDEGGDNQMSELSELTRQDLKEKVLEMIDEMPKEALIELLEVTLGDINLQSIGYSDNR
tara:strand:+ start:1900 stop:2226 length:327 start_codon:yes stop_codon:yes gene_type:complete